MAAAPTVTAAQKDAARKAARAEAEKKRREAIKKAGAVLEKAGLPKDTKLDKDQRERALRAQKDKAGLAGKALADFILEGKTPGEVIAAAQEERATAAKTERTRANVTRSADPEASQLALDAKALAPEVKSAFLPKDAREFLDVFTVTANGPAIQVKRTGAQGVEGAAEEAFIDRVQLEGFAIGGDKDKAVRASLAQLGKGTRLWGRKLGLFILVKA